MNAHKMEIPEEYKILYFYKSKQYNECLKLCDDLLKNRDDRLIELIRMRAMTIQVKLAGNAYEESAYIFDKDDLVCTAMAKTPRPGTSFDRKLQNNFNFMLIIKKRISLTATVRTGCYTSRARSAATALRTASRASRAATSLAGGPAFNAPISLRFLSNKEVAFKPVAKILFEYVFYCEADTRKAIDVAFQMLKTDNTIDWWWNYSLSRCYYTLGMYRQADDCLRKALKQNKHICIYLRLIAMYIALDQPIAALDVCKQGLSVFHAYIPLLMEQAKIIEQMGNSAAAVKNYRMVALQDPSNTEAIANIAMYNFYNDQPEIAMRYYRRLLATSPPGSEIYNNLGLCCLYCSQWDLIIACFRQALYFSTEPTSKADIWFNLAHVALSTGDLTLARRCLQVSLAIFEKEYVRQALRSLDARVRGKKINKK
ncbi:tetratricopeptide repeat protein 8 [Battus philenor]|uniref:tetratricopeptide repeat protein 8 n=1 Tax=Battus philenor TaxID=42288 RepID=UPI0035CEFECE